MQNVKLLLGVIGGTLVLVFGVAFLFSSSGELETQTFDSQLVLGDAPHVKTGAVTVTAEEVETEPEAVAEDSEATDDAEAETKMVSVVEFSDFECPACRAAIPAVNNILAQYPESVNFTYRHFPLESIHANAREAAIASEFVAEQDLFWDYHDILFEQQEEWASENDPTDLFISYAETIGADTEGMAEALEDETFIDRVNADINDGLTLGVNSTPTFFVNGQKVSSIELATAVQTALE